MYRGLLVYGSAMDIPTKDLELLARDKYAGGAARITDEDRNRLAAGEPVAYVIGWIPFLGLRIALDSHPLIPRPETEWWAELLTKRIADAPLSVLDVCAGSGAVGLAVLARCPAAQVSFGELEPAYAELIHKNLQLNDLDASRARVETGDLFAPFAGRRFDSIAANPPYIPAGRALDASVLDYEPGEALFSGADGLDLIRRIASEARQHMNEGGELWLECDTDTVSEAAALLETGGAVRTDIRTDLYGRERLVLAYY